MIVSTPPSAGVAVSVLGRVRPVVTDVLPPVTVLLPVFNGGARLPQAIESVLAQSYERFELLVIDDGSDDGTADYLDSLVDPRVRVVHQSNQGLVRTLNRGFSEASHQFVARMDADDVSEPERLAVQTQFLIENPLVAAVGSCFVTIDDEGSVLDEVHVAADARYLRRSMYFRNSFAHGAMTLRRDRVLQVGGYREVGPCEDYDLWVRLLRSYALGNVPDVLYRYRVYGSQISAKEVHHQQA
ncbi:MAG: glycosyltransferase, partial [Cryobacterium sp.]|nr:glycosyltransferase [Cryobacterium sp.]